MKDVCVAAAQFEARDADKTYNLARVRAIGVRAADRGAQLVCFHECCTCGYTFLQGLSRQELAALAEPVPEGPTVQTLIELAGELGVAIGAGLLERRPDGGIYNTYVVVSAEGMVARHSKLHPFVSEHLSAGDSFTTFDLLDCTFGILICYDNNLVENVRCTTLMGADVILMPHVTGGVPSPMPGRGTIPREVWENRRQDPVRCRMEFNGPKGRGWLMHWLPARAFENGVYAVFSNAVGIDADTVKPGNSMIIDPFGEILAECHELGDDFAVASLTPDKITLSGGRRYIRARRPELYSILVEPVPQDDREKASSRFADVYWKKNP